jgi:hypothetical protein
VFLTTITPSSYLVIKQIVSSKGTKLSSIPFSLTLTLSLSSNPTSIHATTFSRVYPTSGYAKMAQFQLDHGSLTVYMPFSLPQSVVNLCVLVAQLHWLWLVYNLTLFKGWVDGHHLPSRFTSAKILYYYRPFFSVTHPLPPPDFPSLFFIFLYYYYPLISIL